MIADKIKLLREASHLTQTELAKKLNITRSSVNAWEMGISKPSLDNLITLSRIFHTTTDYLLGIENEDVIIINNYTIEEKELLMRLIHYIENTHTMDADQKK